MVEQRGDILSDYEKAHFEFVLSSKGRGKEEEGEKREEREGRRSSPSFLRG